MPRQTLAVVIVQRGGWRALASCMDLLLLWSVAIANGALDDRQREGGVRSGEVDAVRRFGERTSWGSSAKFYRLLKLWRHVLPELDTPGVVVRQAKLSRDRVVAMGQVFGLSAEEVGVHGAAV